MQVLGSYEIQRLVTPELILEPLMAAHAGELFEPLREPSLYQFIPQDPPDSVAALQERYQRLQGRRSPDGTELWLNWLVMKDTSPAGLVQATCNAGRQVFIAYEVFLPFRRQGVASAAVKAMLGHVQAATDTRQALAYVDTRNVASISLLRRLGFAQRRVLQGADFFKGAVSDEYEFERFLPAPF